MLSFVINCLLDFPFYTLLALSFLISFRFLNFPDLALDSSYAAGMVMLYLVTSMGIVQGSVLVSIILSLLFGFSVGAMMAVLHGLRFLKLSKLLSGLVVSFSMYSVLFRLNGHTSTNGLYLQSHDYNRIRQFISSNTSINQNLVILVINVAIMIVALFMVYLFLRSKTGIYCRITGYRKDIITETGSNPLLFFVIGLGISGAISAVAGSMRAATDNYVDINTFGTFLYALASLLVGERILGLTAWGKRNGHLLKAKLCVPLVGGLFMSIVIQACIWFLSSVINVYLSGDIRLIIALVLILSSANFGNNTAARENNDAF